MSFQSCLLFIKLAGIFSFIGQVNGIASVQWFRTAQNTDDRMAKQPDLSFGEDFNLEQVVNVNRYDAIAMTVYSKYFISYYPFRSQKYQTILGFGGAFTDSASTIFSKLNPTLQAQLLDMYFSKDGLRYNMARLPIGSCDFSLENYNYASTSGDANLTHFSIDHDKSHIIPLTSGLVMHSTLLHLPGVPQTG